MLPDGLRAHEPLPAPLLTPTTKAPKGEHDELVSREEIIARGTLPAETYDARRSACATRCSRRASAGPRAAA